VKIQNRNQILIDGRVEELKDLWNGSLQQLLHNPVLVPTS
jgi:hypothetical protein